MAFVSVPESPSHVAREEAEEALPGPRDRAARALREPKAPLPGSALPEHAREALGVGRAQELPHQHGRLHLDLLWARPRPDVAAEHLQGEHVLLRGHPLGDPRDPRLGPEPQQPSSLRPGPRRPQRVVVLAACREVPRHREHVDRHRCCRPVGSCRPAKDRRRQNARERGKRAHRAVPVREEAVEEDDHEYGHVHGECGAGAGYQRPWETFPQHSGEVENDLGHLQDGNAESADLTKGQRLQRHGDWKGEKHHHGAKLGQGDDIDPGAQEGHEDIHQDPAA
mmetsp:Transcript_89232/g.266167  ORF Transcript_89232/g.266167 Transcript_89232/m.266167 type:complete len:281 (+) Transcript_89232:244-1086(+)